MAALARAVKELRAARALRAGAARTAATSAGRTRRPMSAAARTAVSQRMKPYWVARRKAPLAKEPTRRPPWAVASTRRRARVRHGSSLIVDANAVPPRSSGGRVSSPPWRCDSDRDAVVTGPPWQQPGILRAGAAGARSRHRWRDGSDAVDGVGAWRSLRGRARHHEGSKPTVHTALGPDYQTCHAAGFEQCRLATNASRRAQCRARIGCFARPERFTAGDFDSTGPHCARRPQRQRRPQRRRESLEVGLPHRSLEWFVPRSMGLPSLGWARQGSARWMANKNRIHRKRPLFCGAITAGSPEMPVSDEGTAGRSQPDQAFARRPQWGIHRFAFQDTSGLLSRGSQVRILPGAPFS